MKTKPLAHRIITISTWLLLALPWIYVATHYTALPIRIPGHYNASGYVDRYDARASIWILLVIECFVLALLTTVLNFMDRFPKKQNEFADMSGILRPMLFFLRMIVALLFAWDILMTLRDAWHPPKQGHPWAIWAQLALLAFPTVYFLVRTFVRKEHKRI